jgi:hypothetical protein
MTGPTPPDELDPSPELVHVIVPLEIEDGWPPVKSERLWAEPLGDDLYRIDNVPWFARNLAEGDVVRAFAPDARSWPVVTDRISWSGNCTIRIIPLRSGPLQGDLQAVIDRFVPLGAQAEGALPAFALVALTIPPESDLSAIASALQEGESDGSWSFEEGCISDAWTELTS